MNRSNFQNRQIESEEEKEVRRAVISEVTRTEKTQAEKGGKRAVILGITGATGSGKTECGKILENEFNCLVINMDKLAHALMEPGLPCYNDIVMYFGGGILAKDGKIDRKKLGGIVFSDVAQLRKLSFISHHYVRMETEKIIEENKNKYDAIVLDAPVLFGAHMAKMCDYTIGIFADDNLRLDRIIARDNLTAYDAMLRMDGQNVQKGLLELVDFVIYNNEEPGHLWNEIRNVAIEAMESFYDKKG